MRDVLVSIKLKYSDRVTDYRKMFEVARLAGFIAAVPNLPKKFNTPESVMRFDWEKERTNINEDLIKVMKNDPRFPKVINGKA